MRVAHCLLVAIILCVGSTPAETLSGTNTRALLEKLQSDFEQRPLYSVDFKSEYDLAAGAVGPNASKAETKTGRIRAGNGRVEISQQDQQLDEKTGSYVPVRAEKSVWVDGRCVGIRTFTVGKAHEQPFTTVKKYHDSVRPDMAGWFADGILFDSEHFAATLLRCTDLKAESNLSTDGVKQIHMIGVCNEGTVEVWVTDDPHHDLLKARFETSDAYAKSLGDVTKATIEVESVEYANVSGIRLPARAEAMYIYDMPDGKFSKRIRTTRSSYEINPQSDDAVEFAFAIEDGARISDYDESHAQWEWRDGKLKSLP